MQIPTLIPANLEPIQEIPLLEARTEDEQITIVKRMLSNDLPGFVIRSSILEGVDGTDHDAIAQAIAATFTELDDRLDKRSDLVGRLTYTPVQTRFPVFEKFGLGRLHDDDIGDSDKTVVVHKTKKGSGKVLLANSGELHHLARGTKAHSKMPDTTLSELTLQLKNDVVDTNTMSNLLHTTVLNEGDILVKRLGNKNGPIFHRYDTSTETREADITALMPMVSYEEITETTK